MNGKIRLQKYISSTGIASRRKAENLIAQGIVRVNGNPALLGMRIEPLTDIITVDGQVITSEKKEYILFYKPACVVTTKDDPFNRTTVMDYLQDKPKSINHVGRLDYYTKGLILLTNDGHLAYMLTHPRYEIEKTYLVAVEGKIDLNDVEHLEKGVLLEDGLTSPATARLLSTTKYSSILELTLHEGRNRQVRRMLDRLGYKITSLLRTKIAFLTLTGLEPGQHRTLTSKEIASLYALFK